MKQGMSFRIVFAFSLLLSLSLLGACAGVQKSQQPQPGRVQQASPVQPVQVKTPPVNPSSYYYFILSQFKLKEGKIDEAIEDLKTAIRYEDKDPSLHVELATLYVHKRQLNEAVEECQAALARDPNFLPAHMLLGGIYSALKKNPEAIASYRKVIEIDPRNRDSYLYLSSLYSELRDYDQAIQVLQQFLKIEPNSVMGLYSLGRVYAEMKSYDQAKDYFLKALALGAQCHLDHDGPRPRP